MVDDVQNNVAEVKNFEIGDIVSGKVVKVEDKQALVDVGYKTEGILPISEVSNVHIDKVSDVLNVGDEVQLKVIKRNDENDELVLSKRAVDAERAWVDLKEKMDKGEVFEATVANVVKGGLVVDVGLRGFVPASMVERHFVENFDDYKGRTLRLKVVELDRENNRVILSQKAVLDEEFEKQKQAVFDRLKPGDIIEGTVQRLTDFGAFVDVGGVDGLVHISEISWERVDKPSDVLKEGDRVKVKVLAVDKNKERISLSIKETQPGPWEKAAEQIKPGDVIKGTVKRLVSFGAFVEVAPGVEGLVHISQIANRHIQTPSEVLKEGQQVDVKVLDFNLPEKRVSLSIREVESGKKADRGQKENLYKKEEETTGMGVTLGDRFSDLEELKKKLQ